MRIEVSGDPNESTATLDALVITDSGGNTVPLSPVFNSTTNDYTASVTDDQITIAPTASDSNATIEYLNASDRPRRAESMKRPADRSHSRENTSRSRSPRGTSVETDTLVAVTPRPPTPRHAWPRLDGDVADHATANTCNIAARRRNEAINGEPTRARYQ